VLGELVERYLFLSLNIYGMSWVWRPIVLALIALAGFGLVRSVRQDIRAHGGVKSMLSDFHAPRFSLHHLFPAFLIAVAGVCLWQAIGWKFEAKIVPLVVLTAGITASLATTLNEACRSTTSVPATITEASVAQKIHMDLSSDIDHLPIRTILFRATTFFGWLVGFMGSMATIGLIPTVPLFVIGYMRLEAKERWRLVLPQAILLTLFIYVVFERMLHLPWPPTLLGKLWPMIRIIPSV